MSSRCHLRDRSERFLKGLLFVTLALSCLCLPTGPLLSDEPVDLPVYEYRNALIREWKIIGPFPKHFDIGYKAVAGSLETGEPIECDGRKFEWYSRRWKNGVGQLVDECRAADLSADNVKFFAACWLRPAVTEPRRYYFGADDGATYWIDGEEVLDCRGPAWYLWNAYKQELELEANKRHLCIVEARNEGGGYAFSMAASRVISGRVTYFNGATPMQGIEVAAVDQGGNVLDAVASNANGTFTLEKIPYETEVHYECPTGMLREELVTREDGSQRVEIQTLQPRQYLQEEILPLGRVPKRPVTAMCPLPDGRIIFALAHEKDIYVLRGDRVDVLFRIDEGPTPFVSQILATEQQSLIVRVHDRLFAATLQADSTYQVSEVNLPQPCGQPPTSFVECVTLDSSGNLWCCTTSPDDASSFLQDRDAATNKGRYHLHKFDQELKHRLTKDLPIRCISVIEGDGTIVGTGRYGTTAFFAPATDTIEQELGPSLEYTSQLIRSSAGKIALVKGASVAIRTEEGKWQVAVADERTYSGANRGVFLNDALFFLCNDKLLLHQGRTFRGLLSSEKMYSLAAADRSVLCGMSNGTIVRVQEAPYRKFGVEYGSAFQSITRVTKDKDRMLVFSSDNQASAVLSADGAVKEQLGLRGVPIFLRDGSYVQFASHFHYRRRMVAIVPQLIQTTPAGDVRELILDWSVNETILNTLNLTDGRVLVGTVERMHVFDPETFSVTPIKGTDSFNQMAEEGASAFWQVNQSEVFVGTFRGGLYKINLLDFSAEKLCQIEGEEPVVTALHSLSDSELLIGSTAGPFRVSLTTGRANPFYPSIIGKAKIQEFLPAPGGRLYIATLDAGVFSMQGDEVVPIVGVPDLRNVQIADIHLGPNDELVVGTTEGVVEYYSSKQPLKLWKTSLEIDGARSDFGAVINLEEGASVNVGFATNNSKRVAALRYRTSEGPWTYVPTGSMNIRHKLLGVGSHTLQVQAIDRDHNHSEMLSTTFNSYLPLYRWALVRWSAAVVGIGVLGLLIGSSIKTLRAQTRLIDIERCAREAAEENVAERERLLLRVSHDLRNPLFVVAGCAEMIEHGQMEAKAALPILNETVDSMTYLSRQLLSYSKAKAGRHSGDHCYTDVGLLLQKLRDEAHIANREQRVDLRLEVAQDSHMHLAISSQILKEILHNLLNNSIKCTSVGEIVVGYSTDSGKPQFCVQDTGCGMDQETLNCLFKPFFKQTVRRPGNGFGLGLSICKSLSDEIDAKLSVESEVDKGTCVTLELPVGSIANPDEIPNEVGEQETAGTSYARGSVQQSVSVRKRADLGDVDGLLVDDLRFVRDVLVKRLSAIGVTVYDCNSTSIPDLNKFHPKFVLTDLEMPVSSGFDIAQRVKETAPSIVVIAFSERQDLLQEAEKCEYFDIVLTKVSLLTNAPETLRLFRQFANSSRA
ncbi:MAG TPA: hypothetical protein DDW52_28200 [Planctomycetaceae bacterium]|nr:hypothetical protein [Planctomycetaceae bacterium]